MAQQKENKFDDIKAAVYMHMGDADKQLGTKENPGPTPGECYSAAHAVNSTALATGAITLAQWVQLGNDIRGHRDSGK